MEHFDDQALCQVWRKKVAILGFEVLYVGWCLLLKKMLNCNIIVSKGVSLVLDFI